MADRTAIEWCDSTFNPWIGCTKISPACDHCYAARQDAFRKWTPEGWGGPRRRTSAQLWKQPGKWNEQEFAECSACRWRGEVREAVLRDAPGESMHFCPACDQSALRKARRRVFCASLADVFDNQVPDEWREDLFELIRTTPNLDWLLLTKRPQNIVRMVREHGSIAGNGTRYLPDNAWLGTTAEDQTRADQNLPALLQTMVELGARTLFVSVEPMLGPVDLAPYLVTRKRLHWVIAGGESGPGARPPHPDWFRTLERQCHVTGVPFLFKQWGEWLPYGQTAPGVRDPREGDGVLHDFIGGPTNPTHRWYLRKVGKAAAGRLLDGVTHDGFPEVA